MTVARDRANIRLDMWADQDWRDLSVGAQLLWFACEVLRRSGPVSDARFARYTGWSLDFIRQARAELEASQYGIAFTASVKRRRMPVKKANSVFARDGHACRHCGTGDRLTVDHIYPVSLGGGDEMENLQTLCHSCNSRKGARLGLVQS